MNKGAVLNENCPQGISFLALVFLISSSTPTSVSVFLAGCKKRARLFIPVAQLV